MLATAGMALPGSAGAAADPGGLEYDGASVGADGSKLVSRRGELLGQTMRFSGSLAGTQVGYRVEIQRHDRRQGWLRVATTTVSRDGSFDAVWATDHIGRMTVRAVAATEGATAQAAGLGPLRDITIFKPAVATYYGPGFYGRRTACGQRMTRRLMGVAHRTLPCGTQIDLLYAGATITVPVVDRGPFRAGRTWDLTSATAAELGFTHTDTIGAVRVRR